MLLSGIFACMLAFQADGTTRSKPVIADGKMRVSRVRQDALSNIAD